MEEGKVNYERLGNNHKNEQKESVLTEENFQYQEQADLDFELERKMQS